MSRDRPQCCFSAIPELEAVACLSVRDSLKCARLMLLDEHRRELVTVRATAASTLSKICQRGRHMAWLPLLIPFVLGLALILVNRGVYYTASWNGYYCKTSPGLAGSASERIGDAPELYSTSDFCWPSGLFLVKGVRYKISLRYPRTSRIGSTMTSTPMSRVSPRTAVTSI